MGSGRGNEHVFNVAATNSHHMYNIMFQEPEDLFETISQALMNAFDRDAVSGWGAVVYIM